MNIGFLLFSSMLNPTEMYLSKELKNKPPVRIKNLKAAILSTVNKKIGLPRKKAVNKSLDSEIETAIEKIKNPEHENIIDELLAKEVIEDINFRVTKYETPVREASNEKKSAFKGLYQAFVSYAKGAYTKIKSTGSNLPYASKKIIEGPVRMTMSKFVKVFEYILAALNPQWNMPTGSKMDYDTLATAVINHIVINKENLQYGSGYIAFRYRDQ
jgi:hypothetical protein